MIYSAENSLYAVRQVDTAAMPDHRSTLVFECDLLHGERDQKVFLGLMEPEALGSGARCPGIGVAVDMRTGLVTDVVNDQGVLGYLETAPVETDGPLHVRIEVEMIGRVLLPRIFVGADVILHPSLYLDSGGTLSAMVGTSVHPLGDARFENTRLMAGEADNQEVLTAR